METLYEYKLNNISTLDLIKNRSVILTWIIIYPLRTITLNVPYVAIL